MAWAIWHTYFVAKGLDFIDEGLYCSAAWRFAQGALPFRDWVAAWVLPLRWLSLAESGAKNCSNLPWRFLGVDELETSGTLWRIQIEI